MAISICSSVIFVWGSVPLDRCLYSSLDQICSCFLLSSYLGPLPTTPYPDNFWGSTTLCACSFSLKDMYPSCATISCSYYYRSLWTCWFLFSNNIWLASLTGEVNISCLSLTEIFGYFKLTYLEGAGDTNWDTLVVFSFFWGIRGLLMGEESYWLWMVLQAPSY